MNGSLQISDPTPIRPTLHSYYSLNL